MAWKAVAQAFPPGPLPLQRLRGLRVRLRATLRAETFHADAPNGPEMAFAEGCEGFVGHPSGTRIVVAFPRMRSRRVARLESLLSGGFDAIAVPEGTFRLYFEVEV